MCYGDSKVMLLLVVNIICHSGDMQDADVAWSAETECQAAPQRHDSDAVLAQFQVGPTRLMFTVSLAAAGAAVWRAVGLGFRVSPRCATFTMPCNSDCITASALPA